MVAQCLGAICGVGLAKAFMKHDYNTNGGGTNSIADGYSKGTALGAEIIGTFVLVYTVFSATDPKRNARDSHIPVSSLVFYSKISHFLSLIPNPSHSLVICATFATQKVICHNVSQRVLHNIGLSPAFNFTI